jgi:hypothetical protein
LGGSKFEPTAISIFGSKLPWNEQTRRISRERPEKSIRVIAASALLVEAAEGRETHRKLVASGRVRGLGGAKSVSSSM